MVTRLIGVWFAYEAIQQSFAIISFLGADNRTHSQTETVLLRLVLVLFAKLGLSSYFLLFGRAFVRLITSVSQPTVSAKTLLDEEEIEAFQIWLKEDLSRKFLEKKKQVEWFRAGR